MRQWPTAAGWMVGARTRGGDGGGGGGGVVRRGGKAPVAAKSSPARAVRRWCVKVRA